MSHRDLLRAKLISLEISKEEANRLVDGLEEYEVKRALSDGSFLIPLLREKALLTEDSI